MTKSFHEQNMLVYYAETEDEVLELASKVSAGSVIECNSANGFKIYMVDSNHIAQEL